MADIKTAPTVAKSTASHPKSSNIIATIAPIACILMGYLIWRFWIGNPDNFTKGKENGGFWPEREGAIGGFAKMYLGGIIVPILIGCFLTVLTFVIERLLTVTKAAGTGNIAEFIRKVQFHLANKEVEKEANKEAFN